MVRPACCLVLPLAVAMWLAVEPASAQFNPFGWIFGEPPPRPPRDFPERSRPRPQNYPEEFAPESRLPPGPPPAVRSQPLPPLPGVAPPSSLPPLRGARRPDAQPGEEIPPPPPPVQKIANPTAVFSGLDKITGRIIKFDVAINETVQFGALQVTPRVCYTRPATEAQNTDAFVEVDELTLQGEVRRIFTGWMFAASPGLNAVEHPIYDVWLIDCKKEPPTITAEGRPEPSAGAQPR